MPGTCLENAERAFLSSSGHLRFCALKKTRRSFFACFKLSVSFAVLSLVTEYFYCLHSCFHWMIIQSGEIIVKNYWFASVSDCFLNFLAERTHLGNGKENLVTLKSQWSNSSRQEVLQQRFKLQKHNVIQLNLDVMRESKWRLYFLCLSVFRRSEI